jgi:hypothetical protein
MIKYLLTLSLFALASVTASARPNPSADLTLDGEVLLAEGEIVASQFLGDAHGEGWRFVVKWEGYVWTCEGPASGGGMVSCWKYD